MLNNMQSTALFPAQPLVPLQLLDALDACCLEGEVVLAVAPTLSRILRVRRDATLESLEGLSALLTLGRSIKRQQDSQTASKVLFCPHPSTHAL